MPILQKARISPLAIKGKLGNAAVEAAASGAAIGDVQVKLGALISAEGNRVLQESVGSIQTAVFSFNLSKANLEFSKQVEERMNQPLIDENGNPTYLTLSSDIGKIGNSIAAKRGLGILDPKVAAQFQNSFQFQVTNSQIQALGQQRSLQRQHSLSQLDTGVQTFINQAVGDDPSNSQLYLTRIEQVLSANVSAGLLTSKQAAIQLRRATGQIYTGTAQRLLDGGGTSTPGSLSDQSVSNAQTYVKTVPDPDIKAKLQKQVGAANSTVQQNKVLKKSSDDNIANAQSQAKADDLKRGIDSGTASKKDILAAELDNKITKLQSVKAQLYDRKVTKERLTTAITNSKIAKSLVQNKPLTEFTPAQVDDHYQSVVKLMTPKGQELTLKQKASIASQYKGSVPSFNKEIDYALSYGDDKSAIDASKAIGFLNSQNPIAVSKMNRQTQALNATITAFSSRTNLPSKEVVKRSRDLVLNVDTDVKRNRLKAYNKLEDFKPDSIQDTVKGMFEGKTFFGLGSKIVTPDTASKFSLLLREAYIRTGDIDAAKELVKSEVSGIFGETEVNKKTGLFDDKEALMFMPPEKAFPGVPSSVFRRQLNAEVEKYVPDGILPGDVKISSDPVTNTPGNPVSYGLYYMDKDGVKQLIVDSDGTPLRYVPDPARQIDTDKGFDEARGSIDLAEAASKDQALKDEQMLQKSESVLDVAREALPGMTPAENSSLIDMLEGAFSGELSFQEIITTTKDSIPNITPDALETIVNSIRENGVFEADVSDQGAEGKLGVSSSDTTSPSSVNPTTKPEPTDIDSALLKQIGDKGVIKEDMSGQAGLIDSGRKGIGGELDVGKAIGESFSAQASAKTLLAGKPERVTTNVGGVKGVFLSRLKINTSSRRKLDSLKGSLPKYNHTVQQIGIMQPSLQDKMVSIIEDLTRQGFKPFVHNTGRTLKQAQNNKKRGVGIVNSLHRGGLSADIVDSRYGWSNKPAAKAFFRALAKSARKHGMRAGADFGDLAHVEATKTQIKSMTGTSHKATALRILEKRMQQELRNSK